MILHFSVVGLLLLICSQYLAVPALLQLLVLVSAILNVIKSMLGTTTITSYVAEAILNYISH